MENTISAKTNKLWLRVIGVVSVLIPLAVAYLFYSSGLTRIEGLDVKFLPHLNAVLNSATSICLILGMIMIKQKKIDYHRTFMMSAFVLSAIFLVSYVIYHNNQVEPARYGGEGVIRYVYYFILITHIILAAVVVPFVLLAVYFAWTKQISRHKKIVKWTWPIWTYVAISGVIVYLMISPYYV